MLEVLSMDGPFTRADLAWRRVLFVGSAGRRGDPVPGFVMTRDAYLASCTERTVGVGPRRVNSNVSPSFIGIF
jgi:hypothetical protein